MYVCIYFIGQSVRSSKGKKGSRFEGRGSRFESEQNRRMDFHWHCTLLCSASRYFKVVVILY